MGGSDIAPDIYLQVARLGVASVLVSSGVSAAVLAEGLRLFDQQAQQE